MLSTPPAFILSQDQTLNKMVSKQLPLLKPNLLKPYLGFKLELSRPFIYTVSSVLKDSVLLVLLFSRCLIYKVQSRASRCSPGQRFNILALPSSLVKRIFSVFQKTFLDFRSRSTALPASTQIIYQILSLLSTPVFHFLALFHSFFSHH